MPKSMHADALVTMVTATTNGVCLTSPFRSPVSEQSRGVFPVPPFGAVCSVWELAMSQECRREVEREVRGLGGQGVQTR